ncbi:MAG: prepilin-type N-terminal cleavage/methylation domain-containing protein [Planctomycetota bacterium]|nr:prepilin-type N-terminal cleavage/methylation domain-containing protein [Planctomycetota bacterium]
MPPTKTARRAFTLTELLVVIGIIVILIGLLLPALSKVSQRAKVTETQALMQEFGKACDAFQLQFGFYPGVAPENALAPIDGVIPPISGMENALLHLMGGAIRNDDPEYATFTTGWATLALANGVILKINPAEIGKRTRVQGKWYPPFFTPKGNQIGTATGQVNESILLPEVLDSWGQPILYVRAARGTGPLTGTVATNPQFLMESMNPYLKSTALGELALDQTSTTEGSILNSSSNYGAWGAVLRHPGFGKFSTLADSLAGTARGKYVLISPGADGVFYSYKDGVNQTSLAHIDYSKAGIAERYNDIVVFGGG